MNARQSKKNLKNSLLLFPDGSLLKKSAVVAMEKREALPEYKLGPAVIFRFQFGDKGGDKVVEFASESDRDGFMGECQWLLGWR